MRTFVIAVLAFAPLGDVAVAAEEIPCTCRYEGRDMPHGTVICIDLASGSYLARCEKVLNNSAWKRVSDGCPGS